MRNRIRRIVADHFHSYRGAYLLVGLCLATGMLLGTFTINILNDQQRLELGQYIDAFLRDLLQGQIVLQNETFFWGYLLSNLRIALVLWILGGIMVGLPFALLFVGFRGYIIGFSTGFLVYEKGLAGALFAAAAMMPHHLVAVPGLMIAGAAAVQFSSNLLYARLTRRPFPLWPEFTRYSIIMLLAAAWLCAAALVETYITPLFIQLALG